MKLTFEESLDQIKNWSDRCQKLRDYLDNDKSKKKYKAAKLLAIMSDRVYQLYVKSYECFHLTLMSTKDERLQMRQMWYDHTKAKQQTVAKKLLYKT